MAANNTPLKKLWKLLRIVGAVALAAVVIVVLFMLLNWYVAPTKPSGRQDLALALAQILGGTALLSGLYFTWRTLQVNREGQITERFTRAIDQLGKVDENNQKQFEIRLGGIYALERLARESDKDYWPIMEVLTAYVRQHSPWRPEQGQEGTDDAAVEQVSSGRAENIEVAGSPLDPDIRAIITVLRRRTRSYNVYQSDTIDQLLNLRGEPEPLDMHETNLREADFSGADFLSGADLSGADLSGANLQGANLSHATLWKVNFSGAKLSRANLEEASLRGAKLEGADLQGAKLEGVLSLAKYQIEWTIGSNETELPYGWEHPEWWSESLEKQRGIVRERLRRGY